MSTQYNFSASNPDAESLTSVDPRFVRAQEQFKPGCFTAGENLFIMLPPFWDYKTRFQEYAEANKACPLGAFYLSQKIATFGDSHPRSYRVKADNHVSAAFRKLYGKLKGSDGKFTDQLKKLGDGTGGFGDPRCILNVLVSSDAQDADGLRVRWFNCPASSPQAKKQRLMEKFVALVSEHAKETQEMLFDPEKAVVLQLALQFGGTIPAYHTATISKRMVREGSAYREESLNVAKLLGSKWNAEAMNAAWEWAQEVDDLPDLTDIPSIMLDPQACDILGLGTQHVPVDRPVQQVEKVQQAADTGGFGAAAPQQVEKPKQAAVVQTGFGAAAPASVSDAQMESRRASIESMFSSLDADAASKDFEAMIDEESHFS